MNSPVRLDTFAIPASPTTVELLPPEEGLAREQALLDQVAAGRQPGGYLLWRCRRALVVPTSVSRKPGFARASRALADQGWPVVVRRTGGDLVPQSPGLLNVSLAFRQHKRRGSIRQSYEALCRPLIAALQTLGIDAYCAPVPGAFCDGDYNLVVGGQKLAGTAQRWRRVAAAPGGAEASAVLVHAVMLCRDELPELWRITNEFYRHCGIDRYVEYTRHVSVSELLGDDGVEPSLSPDLAEAIVQAIHRQAPW